MNVSVLIPWRAGCPYRERALEWVLARYAAEHPDWQVVVGETDGATWRKADAVALAASEATGEVVVVADADVWCPGLAIAVQWVGRGSRWVVPHAAVHRLSETGTARVMFGWPVEQVAAERHNLDERPYLGWVGGGIVVLEAALLAEAPFDRRFAGWGGEDEAWGMALETLGGQARRLRHPLWHLWHPPQERLRRSVGSEENERLLVQYRRARNRPKQMRDLLSQGARMEVS